jgi:hypothetical protein
VTAETFDDLDRFFVGIDECWDFEGQTFAPGVFVSTRTIARAFGVGEASLRPAYHKLPGGAPPAKAKPGVYCGKARNGIEVRAHSTEPSSVYAFPNRAAMEELRQIAIVVDAAQRLERVGVDVG